MKLYHNPMSPPCRRVLATMYHLDIPLEQKLMDFKAGDHMKPEFFQINPNGAVPALEDGSFRLWESTAIMQYLAEKKGSTTLYPNDAKARADIARWTAWTLAHFGQACQVITFENLVKPMMGMGESDAKAIKDATEKFHTYGKVLNQHLQNNTYLVGDDVTLADFTVASALMYADKAQIPWSEYRQVQNWYGRIDKLDAWQKSAPKF